jgi:RNA polymerase sigma-70 factor (ECF subfamily)
VPDPGPAPQGEVEMNDLLAAIREEIGTSLTPRQREVLVALALNEVPIDVLAERLGATRGALYKVLHDARKRLRAALAERGMILDVQMEEGE